MYVLVGMQDKLTRPPYDVLAEEQKHFQEEMERVQKFHKQQIHEAEESFISLRQQFTREMAEVDAVLDEKKSELQAKEDALAASERAVCKGPEEYCHCIHVKPGVPFHAINHISESKVNHLSSPVCYLCMAPVAGAGFARYPHFWTANSAPAQK